MPALEAFGRRWNVASDDFVIPEFFDILLRSICLAIVGGMSWKNYSIINNYCEGQLYINAYVYGILSLSALVIFTNIALVSSSKTGSIIHNGSKRKHIPLWILTKWILQLAEITWNITGTVWALQGRLACALSIDIFTTVLITVTWVLISVRLVLLYFTFNPIGSYKYIVKDNGVPDPKLVKEWQRKLGLLSCLFTGKRLLIKEGLEEIGYLFGAMFEDVNVVVSDLIAGIILLIVRQKQTKAKQQNAIEVTETAVSSKDSVVEQSGAMSLVPALDTWTSLSELQHFCKYAIAAYTWSMLVLDEGTGKLKDLWRESICCGCMPCTRRKLPFEVTGDNVFFLHSAGLKSWNLENTDVIYADFKNDIFELPFFVAVDHLKNAIVISVRGTVFLNDILVDSCGIPLPMGVPGLPETFKVHHGMLRCAQLIKEKLDGLQLIPKLATTYPDYNLILTGTSLGAGIAATLGFMMRNDHPSLKCYAFAPPGGMLSSDAAEFSKDFVISVVYGDDYVARLGIQSIEALKYQIMDVITECRIPKYKILLGGIRMLFGGNPDIEIGADSFSNKTGSSSRSNGNSEKSDSTVVLDIEPEKTTESIRKLQSFEQLYPPGNLLYVRETDSFHLGYKNPNYRGPSRWTIRWADRSEFREFALSTRLYLDHLPFRISRSLKKLVEEEINVPNSTVTED